MGEFLKSRKVKMALISGVIAVIAIALGVTEDQLYMILAGPISMIVGQSASDTAAALKSGQKG